MTWSFSTDPVRAVAVLVLISMTMAWAQEEQSMADRYPPRVDEMRPTQGWAPQFRREITEPERERVRLQVDWADNALAVSPVTFGVPFPDGALPSVDRMRIVTAEGEAIPAQVEQTATWRGPDGPVRWALVSTRLERDGEYFVEYGSEVSREVPAGIEITETAEALVVDTGAMRAAISKLRGTVLDEVVLSDGEAILTPEAAAEELPRVVDAEGNEYRAGGADEGLTVSVERAGPMEVAVRREGWYVGEDGARFCQFITYTHFFAGEAALRHDHTLVVAFDSRQHQIRDVQIALPLELGGGQDAMFAADESPDGSLMTVGGDALPARLVQDFHDRFTVTSADGRREGERAGGWFGLTDGTRGAFAGWRDFWEQYPAELEADAGVMRLHLWPAHDVDVLNFQPSSWMGEFYPGDKIFHASFYEGGLDSWVQAFGVGKTHNIWISFFGAGERERAAQLTRAFDEPVLALPPGEWNCATEAFGRMRHYDPQRYPELEGALDTIVHRRLWLREVLARDGWMGNYGWINFGDVNYNVANALDPESAHADHWRHWPSMFYGWPNVTPTAYLRSGRRYLWHFARQNTRHITDIDICHLDNEEFEKWRGGRYGGNGAICHYGADLYQIGPDHHLRFMWYDYYLNGSLRTREVAHEYMQGHAARRDEHGGGLAYAHRATGGGLRMYCEAYEATWDPEYLSCMHQFAERMYEARAEDGHLRYDDVYMNMAKIRYYQLTGDERMLDLFLNDMDVLVEFRDGHYYSDSRASSMMGLSHAYWFTGDPKYLPFAVWQVDIARHKIPSDQPDPIQGYSKTYDPTVANQLPVVMQAMVDAGADAMTPSGPPPMTSRAVYFHETEDGEFSLKVDCTPFAAIPGLRTSFVSWREWFDTLPEEARPDLVLTAPDGSEAGRFDITSDILGEPSSMAFRLAQQGRPTLHEPLGKVDMTVPADGQTGTYVLAPTTNTIPIQLTVMRSTLPQWALHTGDAWLYGSTEYFAVPAGTGQFAVEIKPLAPHTEPVIIVRDGSGAEVLRTVYPEDEATWRRLEFDAGAPDADEVWCLYFLEPTPAIVRFDGLPGGLAASREAAFAVQQPVSPSPVPEVEEQAVVEGDLPWGGSALALPADESVRIAAPDGRPLMDAEAGTVEMWVKDLRGHTNMDNRTWLKCGEFILQRRLAIGTYLNVHSAGVQTGFITPQNRWVHMAATWWKLDDGMTDVALFVDGVPVESELKRVRITDPGWPGDVLEVPAGTSGAIIGPIRVSDTVRYDGPFERPAGPPAADEHTTVLCAFDGTGTATVRGQTVGWE